ncbi:hypothetical protein M405DRAFT_841204 [Rhizopogon salebrosus TDB-379]|nr:hypothetical protein M405DRAFT_841204 [Rhizopogon salebrosus TDB-379]
MKETIDQTLPLNDLSSTLEGFGAAMSSPTSSIWGSSGRVEDDRIRNCAQSPDDARSTSLQKHLKGRGGQSGFSGTMAALISVDQFFLLPPYDRIKREGISSGQLIRRMERTCWSLCIRESPPPAGIATYRLNDQLVFVPKAQTFDQAVTFARSAFESDLKGVDKSRISFSLTTTKDENIGISPLAWPSVVSQAVPYCFIDIHIKPEGVKESRPPSYQDVDLIDEFSEKKNILEPGPHRMIMDVGKTYSAGLHVNKETEEFRRRRRRKWSGIGREPFANAQMFVVSPRNIKRSHRSDLKQGTSFLQVLTIVRREEAHCGHCVGGVTVGFR